MLQAHAEQLFATIYAIDERMRIMDGIDTLPIDESALLHPSSEDGAEYVTPEGMLLEIRIDNQMFAGSLRSAQMLCQRSGDIVTDSLIGVWIDEARRRASALTEVSWCD